MKLKDAATRCVLRPVDASKCVCRWRSVPDPAGGAYSAPPDPVAGFCGGGREGVIEMAKCGKPTDGEKREREGKREDGKEN